MVATGIYSIDALTAVRMGYAHMSVALQWCHNERDGVPNHQPHDCLLCRLFNAQIKENIKATHHLPLWAEFTGDRWNSRTNGQ